MEDNGFVTSLFNVQVKSKDGSIKTTYREYLAKHQKPVIWIMPLVWVGKLFKKEQQGQGNISDPYYLSKKDDDIAAIIRGNIKINFDKKTAVIGISVKDQDALICRTISDSVKQRLQDFITDYRTSKARNDYEYYLKLTMDAKANYDKAQQQYGRTADTYSRATLKSAQLKMSSLESDLQLKYKAYTTLNTQLEASKAKVQERTPAFTVVKGAYVPLKPSEPKRMIFVAFILLLTFACTSIYILNKK
jgi:capsule polysaccharide export protein KpsE/RkpR